MECNSSGLDKVGEGWDSLRELTKEILWRDLTQYLLAYLPNLCERYQEN
jgi:deoxyribodipyrimidine photolyase